MATEYPFDRDEAVRLLADFVRVETINPPGRELPGAQFLAAELERRGLVPEITEFAPGRANVVARLRGAGKAPALIYNGHIDVVPPGEAAWSHPPFGGEVHDGRLYGRGSSDMKSGVAAMLIAVEILARRAGQGHRLAGDVLFTAVADEEIGGTGAARLVAQGLTREAGAVVISEPTGFKPYVAEKGTFWLQVETIGRTAHGSMPDLGRNAIMDMQAVLAEIEAIPLPEGPDPTHGRTTLNVGMIRGGVGPNVVPDSCKASLDLRLPPGVKSDAMRARLTAAIARAEARRPGLSARLIDTGSRVAVACSPAEPIVRLAVALCHERLGLRREPQPTPGYATDASVLCSDPPLPFVIIGPGREDLAHKPDEHVELEEYLKAIPFYAALAERHLGPG
jgi:succinyl-diaminopimelate desuccinylase